MYYAVNSPMSEIEVGGFDGKDSISVFASAIVPE